MSAPAPLAIKRLTLRQRVPRIPVPYFDWDPKELRRLASRECNQCRGSGDHLTIKLGPDGQRSPLPCDCVLVRIFRLTLRTFLDIEERPTFLRRIEYRRPDPGRVGSVLYGMPAREYAADFTTLGRRVLTDAEYDLFRMFYLEREGRQACVDALKIERFYSRIQLLEIKLGRAIGQTRPYSLYRVREYFGR